MRSSILLLILSATIFCSCTSAYKTGQTPDDVYFSPQRQQDEYVVKEDNDDRYNGTDEYYDDQYLRMKVRNRLIWSELDDPYYYNPAYSYNNNWNWNNPWNPNTYWNYYYNPYCSPVIFTSKTNFAYNHPRIFNLNAYNNNQLTNASSSNRHNGIFNNNNNYNYNSGSRPVRMVGVNNSNRDGTSGTGNFLRNVFNGSSNNSSSNSSSNNSAGRSSSSSSSSSSGSSSGGSAPVRRF